MQPNTKHVSSWDNHWSFNFRNDPKRLPFVLSRYQFCSRTIPKKSRILELGCSCGIGAPILAKSALSYVGVDLDLQAIESAKHRFQKAKFDFIYDDFMGKKIGLFDAVISLDVIEHILPEYENIYFETVVNNLDTDGICIIGTPNITAAPYASKYSQLGHVNLFSQERLTSTLSKYFYHVFPFGMNDEIVHTGYGAMSHYLFCLCCYRREHV